MKRLWVALALLSASCGGNVELGYADVGRGNETVRALPRDDERPRTKIVVDKYVVELPEADVALTTALAAFRDGSVNLEGDESLARHGLTVYACRPGTWDDIERLLTSAAGRGTSGMCESDETMTFEFLAADRDVTVTEAANGMASARQLKVVRSMLEITPAATRGGGIQVELTPELYVAEPELSTWTLPEIRTKVVVDSGRAVVIHADPARPDTFGPAWLHTGRKRAVIVLSFHLRS